ncbi:MAG: hypothetical protein CVU77_08395 [Elusimicrobia bacterium HGW-Elusimicrobia-1]|jgi:tetratricopeptide (TPR) repeat protein|nr:MAG: hypothetical protein CVU77_08395 [Elusimicrobia bacterium HGW-Elusimicrobia-1]
MIKTPTSQNSHGYAGSPSAGLINSLGKAIVTLTPVFLFLVAIMFYLKTYDSAQIKITITQIGGTALLTFFLIKILEENSWKFFADNNILTLPVAMFMASAVISYFRSPFPWASGNELIRRIVYFALAMIIMKDFSDRRSVDKLIKWVLAAAFVSAAYGIVQFLDGKFFPPNPEPGLDPFIWRQAFSYRIFSTFGNPNFFGDFLAVTSPLTLALYIKTRKPYLLVLWLMITFNVIVTYSKGAWLGYAAGFAAFCLLGLTYFAHFNKERIKKNILLVLSVVLLITGFMTYKATIARTDSIKFRVYTWLSCWEMINTNPALGTGIGSFYVTYPSYRRPQIFYIEGKHNTESDHPENEYLEILYDEGIAGFGIFLWLLGVFIIGGFKGMRIFSGADDRSKNPDARAYYMWGLLSALAGMLAHNAVCVSLRFVSSGVMLWFIIGSIGALIIHNPMPDNPPPPLLKGNPIALNMRRAIQLLLIVPAIWAINVFYGFFTADIYHNIAISFSKQGRWPEALTFYNKVTRNNFGFIMTHYFMGNVYNDRFNINRDFHPEWGDVETDEPWSGIMSGIKGRVDPERSISKYGDVWTLAPNYVQSYHQAGLVHLKLGDYYRQTGDMTRARKEWDRAIYKFERYHAIDPVFAQNYYRMAWVYIQRGEIDKAEETYWRHIYAAKDIFIPGSDEKEWVAKKTGRPAITVPDWCVSHRGTHHSMYPEDWSWRRASEFSETYMNLGNLKYLSRDFRKAEEYYALAASIWPQNLQALKNLASMYSQQGRPSEAVRMWRKVRDVSPNDPDAVRAVGGQ